MAAAESSENSEDETLPVAQLRIVRPAGRGATDLTLPLCARVALVKVKLEHELGVPEADQRLIYGGKVLADAQTLEDIVGTKEGRQTFHLVVPPPPPAPAPPPVDLDTSPEAPAPAPAPATPPRPAAVAPQATPPRQQPSTPITVSPAARAYAEALRNSGFGASPRDATRQFVEDARRALAASQPPAQQQPEPQPHLWDHIRDNEFLDWTLMLKLLAGVALLGQDASRGRVAGLIGAATAAYAVQTGLAYALWELFSSSRPRRRSHQGYRVRSAGEIIRASFDGTIHGPRDGGRLADFGLLVASLVFSLAPPWRPRDRADVLLLRVRDSLSNQIVWFKVKTTTKFGKVYRAFAARQAGDGPQRAWIFSVPGSSDVISEDATPLDLALGHRRDADMPNLAKEAILGLDYSRGGLLRANETALFTGPVLKRQDRMVTRTRLKALVLTDQPRLFYCDADGANPKSCDVASLAADGADLSVVVEGGQGRVRLAPLFGDAREWLEARDASARSPGAALAEAWSEAPASAPVAEFVREASDEEVPVAVPSALPSAPPAPTASVPVR